MPNLETFETVLDYSTSRVYIWTDHYNLLHELLEYVRTNWVPDCNVRYESGNAVEMKRLNNCDIAIGDEIFRRLISAGWKLIESEPYGRIENKWGGRYTLRRAERFTSVVDDLERLTEMLDQGSISMDEYAVFKRKLTD